MAPFLPLICLYAFFMAVLASHRKFAASGAGPALWNLAILGGLFVAWQSLGTASDGAAFFVAGGVVVGGVLMVLLEVPGLLRCGVPLRPKLDLRDPGFRAVLSGMAPVLVGTGVFQLNMLLNRLFAWSLVPGDGPQSWLALSNVLVMAPLGAVAVAMSTAALPALSGLHARGDREGFNRTFTGALRMGVFLLMPAAAYFMVTAEPVVRLLYERGGFRPTETPRMSQVLFWSAAAMIPAMVSMLASRALYALKRPGVPARIAVISVVVNIALSLLLVCSGEFVRKHLGGTKLADGLGGAEIASQWISGAAGLALASALAGVVQMILLLAALRRERKDLDLGPVGVCAVRSLGMTALTAMALHYWVIPSVPPTGEGFMIPLQRAVAPAIAAVFLYTLIASLLGVEEYREFWRAVRGKKKSQKKDGGGDDDEDDDDDDLNHQDTKTPR
jgi:putative peptidoglycan lipid II flippase